MFKEIASAVVLTVETFRDTHNWTHIKSLVAQQNPAALGPFACGRGPQSSRLFSFPSVFTFIFCRSIGEMQRLTGDATLSVSLSLSFPSRRSVLDRNLLQITWTCGGEGYCGLIQYSNTAISRQIVTFN